MTETPINGASMIQELAPSEALRNPLQRDLIPSLQLVDITRVWGEIGEGEDPPLPAVLGGEGARRKIGLSEKALRRLVPEYARELLLWEVGGFHRRSPEDCPVIRMKAEPGKLAREFPDKRRLQWWPVFRPLVERDVVSMLDGRMRIALRGVARVKVLILDIDPTGEMEASAVASMQPARIPSDVVDFDKWRGLAKERQSAARAAAKRAREEAHEALRPAAHEALLVMAERGFEAALLTSRKGWHVVVFLREVMGSAEANAVAEAWAAEVRIRAPGVGMIEAFPKLRADGELGDLCGLPFSEGQRWAKTPRLEIDGDGRASFVGDMEGNRYAPRFQTHAEDVWTFLRRLARPSPDALLESFGTSAALFEEQRQRGPVARERVVPGLGLSSSYKPLHGYDFVCWVEHRLGIGLDAGESWNQIRPVIAAFPYAGHTMAEMLRGMECWLRSGIHRARHCRSEAGIRELLSLCRTQYRYFERGLGRGTYLNGMDAPELRSRLAELAGSRVRVVVRRQHAAMAA